MNWLKITIISVFVLAAIWGLLYTYGRSEWDRRTGDLRGRLDSTRSPRTTGTGTPARLEDLPPPVQRYLSLVLGPNQRPIVGVSIRHEGTFNMSETSESWKPFTSEQSVLTSPPGFIWNGNVRMFPGLPALVHDAYVAGTGILHARLLGLFPVADLQGSGSIAEGELMRYFAETAWYPTALLDNRNIEWESVDERSAIGRLTDRGLSVSLLFEFGADGLLQSVSSEGRARSVNGAIELTPWRGRFWNYQQREGINVPLDGEVSWVLPDGPHPYWRGHITEIEYEFAESPQSLR